MVNTRANSYSINPPDQAFSTMATIAETTTTTTTSSTMATMAAMTITTPAVPERVVTSGVSSPAPPISELSNASLVNSTPDTPPFSSVTAQNIRRERQGRIGQNQERILNGFGDQQADAQLHAVIDSAIGVGQMEMIRLLDERLMSLVPRLVQQSIANLMQVPGNLNRVSGTQESVEPVAIQPPLPANDLGMPPPTTNTFPPTAQNVLPTGRNSRPIQTTIEGSTGGRQPPIYGATSGPNVTSQTQCYAQPVGSSEAPQYQNQREWSQIPVNHLSPVTPRSNVKKMDVEKWRLKFDGTSKSINAEDFIFRLEQLRQDYQCDWDEVLVKFPQLLEGPAEDWYWMQRRLGHIRSFQELKEAFLSQFRKFESDFDVQRRMMDRRQGHQEAFEDFCNAMLRLRNQQRDPMNEQMLVDIMKGNLKPAMAALVFPIRMFGLQHFREECRKAEMLLANQRQFAQAHRHQFAPRVHELEYEVPQTEHEIDAIGRQCNYTCWNCKEKGHGFMDCPSTHRSVFCYGCGMENVVKPSCPRCKGNRPAGTTKGEARPAPMDPR